NAEPQSESTRPAEQPLDERRNAAFSALLSVLASGNCDLRQAAAEALGRIADSRAVPTLVPLLNEQDRWVRQSVADALRQLGHDPNSLATAERPRSGGKKKDVLRAAA